MKFVLAFFAVVLAVFMILKVVYWLYSDIPIGRASMLILFICQITLIIRNRFTYFLLFGIVVFCIIYIFIHPNQSGYLFVDFMSSIHKPMESPKVILLTIPYIIYGSLLCILLMSSTRKIYTGSK